MTELILDDLSNCIYSMNHYQDILSEHESEKVTTIEIEVNRGVDFSELGATLSYCFPSLKVLTVKQNYTCGDHTEMKDFILFFKWLSLEKFTLIDNQSEFLENIDTFTLFKELKKNCTYTIVYGVDPKNTESHIDAANNKYMVYSR